MNHNLLGQANNGELTDSDIQKLNHHERHNLGTAICRGYVHWKKYPLELRKSIVERIRIELEVTASLSGMAKMPKMKSNFRYLCTKNQFNQLPVGEIEPLIDNPFLLFILTSYTFLVNDEYHFLRPEAQAPDEKPRIPFSLKGEEDIPIPRNYQNIPIKLLTSHRDEISAAFDHTIERCRVHFPSLVDQTTEVLQTFGRKLAEMKITYELDKRKAINENRGN